MHKPRPNHHWQQTLLALLTALSLLIAPLAPLATTPFPTTATQSAANPSADLFAHTADWVDLGPLSDGLASVGLAFGQGMRTLYNGLFAAEDVAAQTTAPGGVTSGLEAWVKADLGAGNSDGAAVATWSDQSGNGYDFTQATAGSQPTYYDTTASKLLNFNPVVDFDGTGDYLRNTTVLMPSSSPYTFLAIGVDEDTGTGYRKIFGSEAIVDYFGLYKQGGATNDNGWIPYAVGGQARSAPFIGDRGSMGKGTKYSAAGGANGYWNGTNFTSDGRTDYAQPQIVGFNSLNSATSDPFYTWTDGYKEDPNWSPIVDGLVFRNQFFTQTSIGADVTVELWKGRIPEFMAYSQSLSDSDIAKINTYLAIKYGITLGQGNGHVGKNGNNYNYVDTGGAVIWDATANSTYAYNIAGIGRDDAEALTQKQSQSSQAGFQPVIGLGAIAATNAANSGTFGADKSYLIWGDNGQAANFDTAYAPTSYTPTTGYYRMTRIWKVQETGTVGSVQVQGPANANLLLVDNDGDYTNGGVTEVALTAGAGSVDFTSGQYFTFGAEATAPGGVANGLRFWVRADKEVYSDAGSTSATAGSSVQQWSDQSFNGFDVTQTTASQKPTYRAGTSQSNFNPYTEWQDDFMTHIPASGRITQATDPLTMLATGWKSATSGIDTILELENNSPTLDVTNLDFNPWADGSSPAFVTHIGGPVVQNRMHLFDMRAPYDTDNALMAGLNGYDHANNMELNPDTPRGADVDLGSDSGGEDWDGGITEAVVYNRELSGNELAQVRSYLAIRNGLTLDADPASGTSNYDYLNSAATVIWPGTSDAAYQPYHNNVAGIGRDDASDLDQRKSNSVNGGFQPIIDNGVAFSANNSFLVWGSDTGAASFGTAYAPTSYSPTTGYYRMTRIWKVAETGTVGTVQIQGPTNANLLLVDNDGNYANGGVTEVTLTAGLGTVDFSNGQYFTFGAEATAPGGVAGNMTAWYKADMGAEILGAAAANNDSVDTWQDQSLNDSDAFQSTGSLKPEWLENNGKFNFNPSLTFVPNARMQAQFAAANWDNNDGSIYVIYNQQTAFTGWRNLVDFGLTAADSNNPQLGMSDNDRIATWMDGFDRDNTTFQPLINETRLVGYYWQFNVGGHTYTYDGQPYTGAAGHKLGAGAHGSGLDIGNFANIGGDPQLGEYFPGQIAEIVVYKEQHDAATQARVQSYFGIKYGVTVDTNPTNAATNFDYVDSAGATIWAGNGANSGYHNDIAGIGRDDAAALNQKQSKSINSDDIVTISLGAPAATNAANTNTFSANKSFLIWGNNNGAASFGTTYSPTSFTPAAGYYRMDRVWKVQETGTIANVVVQVNSADHLLVSSDPTFASGVTEVAFSGGSASVDFTNGQYFTFGKELTAPGGVAGNLQFWAKANAGAEDNGAAAADGSLVDLWRDHSSNEFHATQGNIAKRPTFVDGAWANFNFNPTMDYPESQDELVTPLDINPTSAGFDPMTGFIVYELDTGTGAIALWGNDDGAMDRWVGATHYADGVSQDPYSGGNATNIPLLNSAIFDDGVGGSIFINGERVVNDFVNGQEGGATSTAIGGVGPNRTDWTFDGRIAEVAFYNTELTPAQRQQVETYLALKYGITLDTTDTDGTIVEGDYVAPDGTKVWDSAANSAYHNNVAGIGRDDAESLEQQKSKSVNSGSIVIIDNGGPFTADKSYLLWGNNNAATTLSANYNGGANNRLARVWKVAETGTVGAVKLSLPRAIAPSSGLRTLLVHASDPNFGSVDRTYPLTTRGGNYEVTVDFNNGDYFSFSSSSTLPEINVTPTVIDFGEVNTGSTSAAQAVTIQNQGDVSLSISNITLSGADAGQFAISSNNCSSSVSAGGSCTVQLTFTPTASGSRSAFLVITSNDSDEGTVNVVLTGATPGSSGGGATLNQYNLAITKSASVANATVGAPFTYTITVLNKGTIAASNVVMTDQLPAGVSFGSANATGGGNCNESSGTVTCTWASLAGGASATVTITVTP